MWAYHIHKMRYGFLGRAVLVGLISAFSSPFAVSAATVKGRVFVDRDRDGVRGAQETGLGGVVVSDGRNLVLTSAAGDYQIEVQAEVVAPAGVVAAGKLPLLVNAYDTRVNVASVECEVGGQRATLRQTSLEQSDRSEFDVTATVSAGRK